MDNNKKGYITSPQPWNYVINRRETFEELPLTSRKIMFVGDSITQRNEWAEMFQNNDIINRGIDSDRITWLLERTENLIKNNPRKIFLKIGINDIMDGKPTEQLIEEYTILLKEFKKIEDCTIYVQSCLPVNNNTYKHPINNNNVCNFNEKLKELSESLNCKFINLYPHLLSEDKTELDAKYTRDGVHLNGVGYLAWKNAIIEYVL